MITNSEEMLEGFVDAETKRKSQLLDLDTADTSGTTIDFYEIGDGYHVSWKVEYAPMQIWLDCYSRYIASLICVLTVLFFYWIGGFGGYLTGTVFIGIACYAAWDGYKTQEKKIDFDLEVDRLTLTVHHIFEKKIVLSYNDVRSFELMPTSIDDNWGLKMTLITNNDRIVIQGKEKSVKLLRRILEVMLIKINKTRRKQGKEDGIQIV